MLDFLRHIHAYPKRNISEEKELQLADRKKNRLCWKTTYLVCWFWLVLVGFWPPFPAPKFRPLKKKSHGKDDNQVDGRQKRLLTRVVQPLYGTFKSKEIPIVGSIDSGQMIATSHDLGPQMCGEK